MTTLYVDCETYSELDLKTVGTYRYAENCEIMLITWAVDDGPVNCWDVTENYELPFELYTAVQNAETVVAHNAMFDRTVFENEMILPSVELTKWLCTMVQALSHGLPGNLDQLCEILKVPQDKAKIKDGERLIRLFCKPRPKNSKIPRATRETHPEEWQRFIEYAMADIDAMREVQKRLPAWNYPRAHELSHWHLDQIINDRGVMVDTVSANAMLHAVGREKERLGKKTAELTEGRLESTTQVQATIDYIFEEYGVHTDDLTKAQVSALLANDEIPEPIKEILRLRKQAGSSSTSKYKALLDRVSADDRFRGGLQFSGAARTRRASGRGFQPQNLPSRGLLDDSLVELGIEAVKLGCEDLLFENVMHLASSAIRPMLIAAPGRKFCISDLANIEGRKVAWYANEEWKLEAFRAFDAGTGADLYNLAYARAFNVPVESVTKPQRAIGKVMELMLGYAGGVGAFVTGAAGYGFDLEELSDNIFDTLPKNTVSEAYNFLEWQKDKKGNRYGLSDKAFVTVDTLKRLWRNAHPATTQLWSDIQNSAERAVITGQRVEIGKLVFDKKGAWLRIRLPSGRFLCYPGIEYDSETGLSYLGIDQFTRKWQRIRTYSGKLLENICQSSARDVLYDSMPIAEENGFPIVLHVHDELVTETRHSKNVKELEQIMAAGHSWTTGLPLAASGFESQRYRK